MNTEQLQVLVSSLSLPSQGGFDSATFFDQLTTISEPLKDLNTFEYREQLFHGATAGLDQLVGAIPNEVRNFSDAPGLVESYSFSEPSTQTVIGSFTRTTTNSNNTSDGIALAEDTPLETNLFHEAISSSSLTTNRSGSRVIESTDTQSDVFGIDNQLVNLTLQHTDTDTAILGRALESSVTTLSLDVAGMAGVDVGLTNITLSGQSLEVLSLSYPDIEGGQDSLALPTSTNILLPLALGATEGFANNPDPADLANSLTGLVSLPEPIGALAAGGNPFADLNQVV